MSRELSVMLRAVLVGVVFGLGMSIVIRCGALKDAEHPRTYIDAVEQGIARVGAAPMPPLVIVWEPRDTDVYGTCHMVDSERRAMLHIGDIIRDHEDADVHEAIADAVAQAITSCAGRTL